MVNAKAKGTRQEHRSREILEAAGYRVTRAGGSLGVWDLIGIGPSDIVLCQVKTRDFPGKEEMEEMERFAAPPWAKKIIHRWRARQRYPDIKILS